MSLIEINMDKCNKDGICAAICPAGLIEYSKDKGPRPVTDIEDICIACGHCVAVCPTGCLTHRDIPVDRSTPINNDQQMTPQQVEQFLRSRRSIRTYKKKQVSRNILQKLIELARYAPTGHNSQGVEWLVIDNRQELDRYIRITIDWMEWMLKEMSDFARSLHMDRAVERHGEDLDVILRGAPTVVVAHAPKDDLMAPASCTIALTYLELAALGMGLGTCWAGFFNAAANTYPTMMKALSLPEGHQCFGAMMVGYPRFAYQRLPIRKPPSITWR